MTTASQAESKVSDQADNASNRRRILRVKNKFQDRMILEVILVTFIFINILVIASFFALETIHDFYRLKLTLAVALAAGELGGLAIVYYFSLRSSHRIAGPVFMIERRLNEMAEGDLTVSLRLRRNDHFHETSDILNQCVSRLSDKVSDIRGAALALKEEVGDDGKAAELAEQLLQKIDKFKTQSKAQ